MPKEELHDCITPQFQWKIQFQELGFPGDVSIQLPFQMEPKRDKNSLAYCDGLVYESAWLGYGVQLFGQTLVWMLL